MGRHEAHCLVDLAAVRAQSARDRVGAVAHEQVDVVRNESAHRGRHAHGPGQRPDQQVQCVAQVTRSERRTQMQSEPGDHLLHDVDRDAERGGRLCQRAPEDSAGVYIGHEVLGHGTVRAREACHRLRQELFHGTATLRKRCRVPGRTGPAGAAEQARLPPQGVAAARAAHRLAELERGVGLDGSRHDLGQLGAVG